MARPLLNIDYPSVEERIADSTESWIKDLKSLFENAKDRFGDVCWESEDLSMKKIWGHKSIIYSRAPKAFKERYFKIRSNSNGTNSRLLSPALLPTRSTSRPVSPSSNYFLQPHSYNPSSSQLSLLTTNSEGTLRPGGEDVLQLQSEEIPELFLTQLEWLYTGEGLGDVVHWIDTEPESNNSSSKPLRPSSSSNGDLKERREKLGQDLTYMWRSKLYADVRIHLDHSISSPSGDDNTDDSDGSSVDSLSSTAVFTSHKFILSSRSPYFASALLSHSSFLQSTATTGDIHLPTPPFTPASLHFCLGYIYAGHLDFSNRTFDLTTSFAIHRAAAYLQLDSLVAEIESRIVHNFAHGLDWDTCRCKKCLVRIPRIWKFAMSPDVAAITLEHRAKIYLTRSWTESWTSSKEIGLCDSSERDILTKSVQEKIHPHNLISTFQAINTISNKLNNALRTRIGGKLDWISNVEEMVNQVEIIASRLLIDHFSAVVDGREFGGLVNDTSFNLDTLEYVLDKVTEQVGSGEGYREAPLIYQSLVTSSTFKSENGNSLQPRNAPGSRSQVIINNARSKILSHINRRWMQIREVDGFRNIEPAILRELSDEIDVPLHDLIGNINLPFPPRANGVGNTTKTTSSRSKASTAAADRFTSQTLPQLQPHTNGLKRLRLHSSVSTSSSTGSLSRASRFSLDNRPERSSPSISSTRTINQNASTTSLSSQRRPIASRKVGEPATTSTTSRLANPPPPLTDSHSTNTNPPTTAGGNHPAPLTPKITSPRSVASSKRSAVTSIGYKPSPSISSLRKESPSTSSLSPLPTKSSTSTMVRPRISNISPRTRVDSQPTKTSGVDRDTRAVRPTQLKPKTNAPSLNNEPPLASPTPQARSTGKPWTGPGVVLNIGIPCIVSHLHPNGRSRLRFQACIRYIGHMDKSKGPWIGIEGNDISKLGIKTLKDGSQDGISYFTISEPKMDENERSSSRSKIGNTTMSTLRTRKTSSLIDHRHPRFLQGKDKAKTSGRDQSMEVLFVRPAEVVFIMTSDQT
ncbi:hypothetical protein L486_03613 [Kwoniella mangroviensis CBS 10435]|uniref:BTB domain-containing protein n=1 Tax=Kwoniella mangroviensis CBS 10435 TaxID=1331196 RepID=A0A1B9IUA3_9TREE|nr:hypothetical protein L486_03613 [Kwoniella mangroviensis CBS 10435]